MTASHVTATDVSRRILEAIQDNDLRALLDRCRDDVVFEFPFAPAGRPRRVEGRDAVRAYLEPLFATMRVERLIKQAIHQSIEPSTAVIEFTATLRRPDGKIVEASYVVVLDTEGEAVTRYRDYWSPLALSGDGQ